MRQPALLLILLCLAFPGCETDGGKRPARSYSLADLPATHLSLAGETAAPFPPPGEDGIQDLMPAIRCAGALLEQSRGTELVATMSEPGDGHLILDVPAPPAQERRGILEFEYLGSSGGVLRLGGRGGQDQLMPSAISARVRADEWESIRFALDDPRLPREQPTKLCLLPPAAENGEIRLRGARWIAPRPIHRGFVELEDQLRDAWLLAPDSAMEWELEVGAGSTLHFGYGNALRSMRTGDGVHFFVDFLPAGGGVDRLWSRTLLAHADPAHRGWQEASVTLPAGDRGRAKLRIGVLASPPREAPFEQIHSEAGDAPAISAPRIDTVEDDRPNILLIVVDTLRFDGFQPSTMPLFFARRHEFASFERAYATGAWTHPSTGSIWSGLLPQQHGLGGSGAAVSYFDPDIRLLPEILRGAGYATAAVSNNLIVSPVEGFARGIDSFDERALRDAAVFGAQRVSRAGDEWLAARGDSKPFFLYLHYFDPHDRYAPPREYMDAFAEGIDWNALPSGIRDGQVNGLLDRMVDAGERTTFEPPADQIAALWALYRAEILYADHWIDWLLRRLESRGQLENTLVILTADHGEEFYEHGGLKHGHSLHEELLHVPLAIRFPDGFGAGETVAATASLVDLFPTLLGAAEIGALGIPGQDLHAWLGESSPPTERTVGAVLFEAQARDNRLSHPSAQALWMDQHKLLREFPAGRPSLYDLVDDPRESNDLTASEHILLDRLVGQLNLLLGSEAPRGEIERVLDPDLAEKLKALGYVD